MSASLPRRRAEFIRAQVLSNLHAEIWPGLLPPRRTSRPALTLLSWRGTSRAGRRQCGRRDVPGCPGAGHVSRQPRCRMEAAGNHDG